jgi:ankyrin repeat protein
MSINKFDKIYNPQVFIDNAKRLELFNIINTLNTSELLQYSLINKISLNQCNDNDDNLIHVMIRMDDTKITEVSKLNIIKFLVQNNVYPDKPNKNNNTPLHLACELQYYNIVEYLLTIGVNPNFTDNNGNTAFHYLLTGNIKLIDTDKSIKDFIPKTQNRNIKINFTNTFNDLTLLPNHNIQNLSSYPVNNNNFIIFMNDFTNTSLMKSKYNIDINQDIIRLLLNYKANPYINNQYNISPIHNILKNYNYNIFTKLKNIGIDFNRFNSDNPKKFIDNEIKNNNDRLFGKSNNSISKILSNITEAHYNEFKALILNNPRFGNNFLRIFDDSFNITAYLTFYILSEKLIELKQVELNNVFTTVNIPKTYTQQSDPSKGVNIAFNSSHLFNNIGLDKDGNPINIENQEYIQLQNLLNIKIIEKNKFNKTCIDYEYTQLIQEITNIENRLNTLIIGPLININNVYSSEDYINIWNNYFNSAKLDDKFNYNLLPLYLLLNNKNENEPLLKYMECFCIQYFTNKFLSDYSLGMVYGDILKPQTELVICHSIKTVILNIINNFVMENEENNIPSLGKTTYLYSFNYNYFINNILTYLPVGHLMTIDDSFLSISDKLIRNILNIFFDIDESNTNRTLEAKDIILVDIINNMKNILESLTQVERHALFNRVNKVAPTINVPGLLNDYDKPINTFINLLENHVVVYFDTIIPKLLTSWLSIVENIFKYIINYTRMIETSKQLNS